MAIDPVPVPLKDLLAALDLDCDRRWSGVMVRGITADSRTVRPGFVFVAIPGTKTDGGRFIHDAVRRGCAAVFCEDLSLAGPAADQDLPVVEVAGARRFLARLAAEFHGHPEEKVNLIGITGTNGKTTTSYLLESICRAAGRSCGVIGTINYRWGGWEEPAALTTPGAERLYRLLAEMVAGGVQDVIMEVSSHALAQARLGGLRFDVAVFTNLSRDHLDYHGDMESYYQTKKTLFVEHLKGGGAAVICQGPGLDESEDSAEVPAWGERLAADLLNHDRFAVHGEAGPRLIICGLGRGQVQASEVGYSLKGIKGTIRGLSRPVEFNSRLVGDFNLMNILGAGGAALSLGIDARYFSAGIKRLKQVPGRLEAVEEIGTDRAGSRIFIDYAHTPDALERLLKNIRKLTSGRLILVFGCGGNRDRGKRCLMGRIAGLGADIVLVTSDNPRDESPEAIIGEIEKGLSPLMAKGRASRRENGGWYELIVSRRLAIEKAVQLCGLDDVLLISGKGHEDYQILKGRKTYFDDRFEVLNRLAPGRAGVKD